MQASQLKLCRLRTPFWVIKDSTSLEYKFDPEDWNFVVGCWCLSLLRAPVPFQGQGAGGYLCLCCDNFSHSHHHFCCINLQRERRWNHWGHPWLHTHMQGTCAGICLGCQGPVGCGLQGDAHHLLNLAEGGEEWSFVGSFFDRCRGSERNTYLMRYRSASGQWPLWPVTASFFNGTHALAHTFQILGDSACCSQQLVLWLSGAVWGAHPTDGEGGRTLIQKVTRAHSSTIILLEIFLKGLVL